jgi:endoglucanase
MEIRLTVTNYSIKKVAKTSSKLIFLLTLIGFTHKLKAQAVWNNTSFVHRQGQQMVDGSGNIIKLNGVNLGGWLMWEGWIWGGGFTAEKDFNNKLQSIIGASATNAFRDSVHKKYITRADIQKISEECFNVVRIPFNHTLLEDDSNPYFYKPSGWAVLDSVLSWCEDYNVYAILDLHAAPGGQNTGFIADPDAVTLWESANNKDRTVQLWKAIATRYKERGIIAGYDLLNEPNVTTGSDLVDLYNVIIDSIRSVDTNHMLHIEGNDYSKDFSMFTSLPDENMCFHFHFYTWFFPNDIVNNLIPYTNLSNTFNVPIWCGEWGENDMAQLDSTLTLFNDPTYKLSGNAFWTWKKQWKLIAYPHYAGYFGSTLWDKTTTWIDNSASPIPTTSEVQQGIQEFLTNVNLSSCWFNTTLSDLLKVCNLNGINEQTDDRQVLIAPNPFSQTLNIVAENLIEKYELINTFGQIIWSGSQIGNQDFSDLSPGAYSLRIIQSDKIQIVKVIKN